MSFVAKRYYTRGLAAMDRGDTNGSLEALRAAVDLLPVYTEARVAYAIALARMGDCPRGAQVLRAGLGRPCSPVASATMWATLGDVLTRGGDFYGAEDAFKQAGQHSGFQGRAAAGLARVYAKLGRYPESFEQLKLVSTLAKEFDDAAAATAAD